MKGLPRAFAAELIGTALLILVGLSVVIVMFGDGSPLVTMLPNAGLRRLVTGFLFGSTGALVAVSWVGKHSGAHINPVVTLAFWLKGKMDHGQALGYILAQVTGATLGALPLLLWGSVGRSVAFGATIPDPNLPVWYAVLGEIVTTFALVTLLFLFIGHKRLARFTPLLFPFLYAIMVFLEASLSGTSTNPARSFGPAVVSAVWRGWWVYWLGPVTGCFLGLAFHRLSLLKRFEIEVAKIYHFQHDPDNIFHKNR